jgi:predicted small secreted protein
MGPAHSGGFTMPRLTAVLSLIVLLSTAALVSACNTTAGVGEDVSSAGHAVTGAADSAK